MRPFLLGVLLFLHALAQAGGGTSAAGVAPPLVIMPLWLIAMCGFMAASFAIFGVDPLRPHAATIAAVAAAASALLHWIAGMSAVNVTAILVSVALAIMVRWWARCSHPEIHTPTMVTSEMKIAELDHPTVRRRVAEAMAWCLLGWTALLVIARPWHQAWGATRVEQGESIPGEDREVTSRYRIDHAVTVSAPAARVWPWVAQLGQDRAGFYSYDWLERAFGDRIANVDSLVPEWQTRSVGDLVRATQPDYLHGRFGRDLGWRIAFWDPPRSMVLTNWGAFSVRAITDSTSRVVVQTRGAGQYSFATLAIAPLTFYLLEPAHFVMERGMLLGIKRRAERAVAHR